MSDQTWITKDRRVCIKGYGTASLSHVHTRIERLTPTLIICANGRRFRRTDRMLPSVPYMPYGGHRIAPHCQVKKS